MKCLKERNSSLKSLILLGKLRWEAEQEGGRGGGQISRWLVRQLAAGRVPRAPAAEAVASFVTARANCNPPVEPPSRPAPSPSSPPFRVFQGGKKNPGTLTFQRPVFSLCSPSSFALVFLL